MSSTFEDVRMWAHYADSFKGVAIEIVFDDDNPDLHPVDYRDELPSFAANAMNQITAADIMTKKTKHWLYESETRLITEKEFYCVKGRISAIYLGMRVSEAQCDLLSALKLNISIYRTELDKKNIQVVAGSLIR